MNTTRITSQQLLDLEGLAGPAKPTSRPEESFARDIGEALSNANVELNRAEASARELAAGKGDLVETMIQMGRADLSLRTVVNLRNRMLESYQEIMRLQV